MIAFNALFPEIGFDETRTMSLPPDLNGLGIPSGDYGLLESYCIEPNCDCRRVMLNVFSRRLGKIVATISHSFEPPLDNDVIPDQTFLDPINIQSPWANALMTVFKDVALTPDYAARLIRHYQMVKDALKDPRHPIHGRIARLDAALATVPVRRTPVPPRRRRKGRRR